LSRKRKGLSDTQTQPLKLKSHKHSSLSKEDSTPPRNFYSFLKIDVPDLCGSIEPFSTPPPSLSRKRLTPRVSVGGIVLDSAGKGTLSDCLGNYSVCCHRGRRKIMQDSFITTTNNENHVYGVFDGHGEQGQKCASLCAKKLVEYASHKKHWNTQVERGFQEAFQQAHKASLQSIQKGGSTACCAYVTPEKVWVANVGDSRCVISRNGTAIPLSSDHKPDLPEERKRIESQGGQVVYYNGWRVEGILSVSRSLGNKSLAKFLSSEADITEHTVADSDEFIILATDGLWGAVDSQKAVNIVRAEMNKAESAGLTTSELVQRASEALVDKACGTSMDNICCVVAFLNR